MLFKIVRENRDYFCTADNGPKFFVGRRVPYEDNIGLYNVFAGSKLQKINYDPANYDSDFGFWAQFIDPTASCEGRNFLTLNTYDRAAFTFGFTQFAAHVPNGDFVRFFKQMLARPEASDYFPSLEIRGGRIVKTDGPSPVVLEDDDTTRPLMRYLNPTLEEVEDAEVIAAARFIHWTVNHREARLLQIGQMVETYRGFMKTADKRGLIDGRPAGQCCVIADILHQGRAGKKPWTMIEDALASTKPLDRLLEIGLPRWKERLTTLKSKIAANPGFASKTWSRAVGDFV